MVATVTGGSLMIQTLRTLIVDDEPLAIERLQILTGQQDGVSLVGTASDGASALRMVDALAPDLVLCDIAMPDLNGLEVAAAIDRLDNPPAVIFVTAFDQYAVAAFDVAAVDYLLKPVSPDRLARALTRVREWRATERAPSHKSKWINEFWVQNRGEMLRIDAGQVDLIEADPSDDQIIGSADEPRSVHAHSSVKNGAPRRDRRAETSWRRRVERRSGRRRRPPRWPHLPARRQGDHARLNQKAVTPEHDRPCR
jgi:YesN/AraC family two-component response regulator